MIQPPSTVDLDKPLKMGDVFFSDVLCSLLKYAIYAILVNMAFRQF